MICRKTMRNFVGQWSHVKQSWQKICTETLKNVFSKNAKKGFKKHLLALLQSKFFHVSIINKEYQTIFENDTLFKKQCKPHIFLGVFSLFFKMLFWYPHEKSKLVTPLTTYTIQEAFINFRELFLHCTHFGKWTLDLSNSDQIIFKRSYSCKLPKILE